MLAALKKAENERLADQARQEEEARRDAEERQAQWNLQQQQWKSELDSLKVQGAATIAAVNDTKEAVTRAASEAAERDATLLAKQQQGFDMVSAQLDEISRKALGSSQEILSAIEANGSGDSQAMQDKMDKLLAEMGEVQAGQELIRKGFNSIMSGIESMNAGLEIVRKTIVNNFSASAVPITFVIVPGDAPVTEPDASSDGTQHGEDQAEQTHGAFDKFKNVFNPSSSIEKMKSAWDGWKGDSKTMKLYLVDMYSWQPVGDGYEVSGSREMASKFLPIMAGVVKTMKVVRGVAGLGRLLGAPIPVIPEAAIAKASAVVDSLDVGSDYACVSAAAEEAGANKSISMFQEASHNCPTAM